MNVMCMRVTRNLTQTARILMEVIIVFAELDILLLSTALDVKVCADVTLIYYEYNINCHRI